MVKITFVGHSGKVHEVEADAGLTLLNVAIDNSVPGIIGDCGGAQSCATCHVYVRPEWLESSGKLGDIETAMLEMAVDPMPNSRLSCCITVGPELTGFTVDIPASQF